ncbi:MAG: phosphatidylserine decarboxylase family protein [Planctomycetota bacterium]|jgi:phosphatidylserine decarboxylase|nr:MAG: phosphatidylserine decarboxylase family protein [Planctomycetota bacterium]RLS92403.1 MAG: phosphatidylserine decarboxylase family protein [Planctomycetota bacterium]
MLLTRYGLREWMIITLAAAIPAAASVFLHWWWLTAIAAIAWLALASFFRDPLFRRPATIDARDLVSPADGLVSAVLEVAHHPATDGPATIVRIYLSVLDVHINRAPCEAVVLDTTHTPGKYLDVRIEESAKVNESMLMRLRTSGGIALGVKQISGKIARHIVCPVVSGRALARGERYGMIKFGSTTELIVPTSEIASVRVVKGDRVVGGVTVLVSLKRV